MVSSKNILLIFILLPICIYLTATSYGILQKVQFYPECQNYSYEERKNFLSKTTYIHGTITAIKDDKIDVYVNYNPRNRWKCSQMESPYKDYLGATTKIYSVNLNQNTPIYSMYEAISTSIPNDHTPRQNPSPEVQIPSENTFTGLRYKKEDLTIGYRVAVLASKPVLKENLFDAELVLIYPERDITYSAIITIIIVIIAGIGSYYTIEVITHILYYFTKNTNILLFSTVIRPVGAIGFFIWYFLSHYT